MKYRSSNRPTSMAAARSSSRPQVGATPMSARRRAALGERPVHPRVDRLADEVQAAARVLDRVGRVRVDDDRAADLDRADPRPSRRAGAGSCSGCDQHVGVHQEHVGLRRLADADVPRPGSARRCGRACARGRRGSRARSHSTVPSVLSDVDDEHAACGQPAASSDASVPVSLSRLLWQTIATPTSAGNGSS